MLMCKTIQLEDHVIVLLGEINPVTSDVYPSKNVTIGVGVTKEHAFCCLRNALLDRNYEEKAVLLAEIQQTDTIVDNYTIPDEQNILDASDKYYGIGT